MTEASRTANAVDVAVDPGEALDSPSLAASVASKQERSTDSFDTARRRLGWSATAMVAAAIVMGAALFLPWSTADGTSHGLAEYAAPVPSVVYWILLALGLALCLVTVISFLFGTRAAVLVFIAGGAIYGIGAVIWYVSTILPNLVASGCISNPGSLCSTAPGSPTLITTPSAGFILALVASVFAIASGLIAFLVTRP